MRKIVYFSTFFQPEFSEYYLSHHTKGENLSASTFSFSICKGLSSLTKNLQVINIPPIGQFPLNYKRLHSKGGIFTMNDIEIESLKYSSIYLYQHYSLHFNLKKVLSKNLDVEQKYVFLFYSLIEPQIILTTLNFCKKHNIDAKYCLIIPDFIEDINSEKSFIRRIKTSIYRQLLSEIYDKMNGFIFLTENMKERISLNKRPYAIVEGMFDTSSIRQMPTRLNKNKVILYSGMLHDKFGVRKLIDAFLLIKDESLRLMLCGSGDQEDYIKACSLKDKRIIYKGIVNHEEVLKLQTEAFLLINPRSSEGEYTKYSFPSKTMEYLASGTPTLIYQLEGIPKEYYNYCYSIKDRQQDPTLLSEYIMKICSMDNEVLRQKAEDAKSFIYRNKSASAQCVKILELINII